MMVVFPKNADVLLLNRLTTFVAFHSEEALVIIFTVEFIFLLEVSFPSQCLVFVYGQAMIKKEET